VFRITLALNLSTLRISVFSSREVVIRLPALLAVFLAKLDSAVPRLVLPRPACCVAMLLDPGVLPTELLRPRTSHRQDFLPVPWLVLPPSWLFHVAPGSEQSCMRVRWCIWMRLARVWIGGSSLGPRAVVGLSPLLAVPLPGGVAPEPNYPLLLPTLVTMGSTPACPLRMLPSLGMGLPLQL
jgi:hypothetical protein